MRKPLFFYSPEDGGASAQVEQAAEQVADAAENLQTAAAETGSGIKSDTFELLHTVLTNIHSELKRANDRAESTEHSVVDVAEDVVDTPAEVAEVAVETPPAPKKVRRGFRKVAKR